MQFKEIPRKLIVAKRLAQCLNPALPTGVHQRALEVYIHILAVLGVCIIVFQSRNALTFNLIKGGRLETRSITVVIWIISLLRIRRYVSQGKISYQ